MNGLFDHALQNMSGSDIVGMTIINGMNQNDKPIGIIFRRKLSVFWRRDIERL